MEKTKIQTHRSARLRSNWAISESSNVGCMKRVNKCCDWFEWFGEVCCCCSDDRTLLAALPKPTMPLPADDADAAANNNGFDVIVMSRPELVVIDACCWADAFDALDEPTTPLDELAPDDDDTGWGRRGKRSSCCRAAWRRRIIGFIIGLFFYVFWIYVD